MVGKYLPRACACLLSLGLASGCSPGHEARGAQPGPSPTIVVDGMTLEVSRLTEAVAGLCQARREAATDAQAAKDTFSRRSEYGVDMTTRILQGSHRFLAGSMAKAVERLRADLAGEQGTKLLYDDLGQLVELTREGLARFGIVTRACQE